MMQLESPKPIISTRRSPGPWATEFFVEGPDTPPEYTVNYQGRLIIAGDFSAAGVYAIS